MAVFLFADKYTLDRRNTMNKHKKLSRIVASLLAIIAIISVIPLQTAMADNAASYVGGQGENIGGYSTKE